MYTRLIRNVLLGSIIGLVFATIILYLMQINHRATAAMENEPRGVVKEEIFRFHIRANSNSEEDISLKYKVRDAVLDTISENIGDEEMSRDEYISKVYELLPRIKTVAGETIRKEGYSYQVNAYIGNEYFPMRQYGKLVIPADYYDALMIDIGSAEGENFWCMLYPDMCYPIDGGAVVSKEGEKEISRKLTEEEYRKLFVNKEDKEVKVKFRLFEWVSDIF